MYIFLKTNTNVSEKTGVNWRIPFLDVIHFKIRNNKYNSMVQVATMYLVYILLCIY